MLGLLLGAALGPLLGAVLGLLLGAVLGLLLGAVLGPLLGAELFGSPEEVGRAEDGMEVGWYEMLKCGVVGCFEVGL